MFNNIIEDYSSKWKTKKQKEEKKKAKKYYQTNYDKLREKYEKAKKWKYANNKNKNMSDENWGRKKDYMRIIIIK